MATGALRCALGVSAILGIASACGGAVRTGGDGNGGAGGATTKAGGATSESGTTSAGGASAAGGSTAAGGSGATGTTLRTSDFDQRCDDLSDCFVVNDGEQCVCNQCPDGAINLDESARWAAAFTKLSCPLLSCTRTVCEPKAYFCNDNKCVVTTPPTIVADDFDKECRGDGDCSIIPTGQLCNSCDSCGSVGAVSNVGLSAWAAVMNSVGCAAFGLECPCNAPVPQPAVCEIPFGSDTGSCRLFGEAGGR